MWQPRDHTKCTEENCTCKERADFFEQENVALRTLLAKTEEALEFYMMPPISQLNDHHIAAAKLGVAALTAIKQWKEKS